MPSWRIAIAFLICSGAIGAANVAGVTPGTSIRPPLLGYVQLRPGEVRPITGFVGANVVLDALPLGVAAFPAPGQEHALVRFDEPARIGVARLDADGLGAITGIAGALAGFDHAIFSSSGRSVILQALPLRRLQVITGLPDQPRIAQDIDISPFPGTFVTAAVTDDAEVLLAAFSSGQTARLVEIRNGNTSRTLLELPSVSALRYVPGGHAAVLADPVSNQIVMLGEDGSPLVLAGAVDGVNGPVDIETSAGGRLVFVANSGANLLVIDRETRRTRTLTCGFVPFSFQRLMRPAVAVLARDGSSLAVLDTDAGAPWAAYAPKVRF